jgi:hypothetical protein
MFDDLGEADLLAEMAGAQQSGADGDGAPVVCGGPSPNPQNS